MKLTNTAVIPGLHANLFSVIQALQKGFQMTPESDTLIPRKNSIEIRFDGKMANKYGEGLLLTTKFYKIANNVDILDPGKQKPEGKGYIQPKGTSVKKQDNTTITKLRRGKFTPTKSMRSSAIQDKIVCARPQSTYNVALRGR